MGLTGFCFFGYEGNFSGQAGQAGVRVKGDLGGSITCELWVYFKLGNLRSMSAECLCFLMSCFGGTAITGKMFRRCFFS